MSPTETPQDRPHPSSSNVSGNLSNSYGSDRQGNDSAGVGTMQHDLEVAQACLNLRQESKAGSGGGGVRPNSSGASVTGGGGGGGQNHGHGPGQGQGQGPEQGIGPSDDPRNSTQTPQMDHQRSSGGMNNHHMGHMPPMPPPDGGGRMPMHQMHMMPGSFMPSHSMMDQFGGPPGGGNNGSGGAGGNNGPGGMKDVHPSYYNMGDNGGHFYHQMPPDAEQYHAMMNGMGGMGGMREMPYYMMNPNDPNMMNHNGHFYPPMMPPESGHFNSMMGTYPQGGGGGGGNGGYMQQKRQHPDDYSMHNDFKRRRSDNSSPNLKAEDVSPMPKKVEKQKKGKRASDMPRRPLSAYNFFFSEERERILAAIPDPDGENEEQKTESSQAANEETPDSRDDKDKDSTEKDKEEDDKKTEDSGKETKEKMNARSTRLLNLREQQSNKRRPHRKTHGKIGFKELVKKIGERWRALSSKDREYYSGLAETDLKRYKEQMNEYNNKHNRIGA